MSWTVPYSGIDSVERTKKTRTIHVTASREPSGVVQDYKSRQWRESSRDVTSLAASAAEARGFLKMLGNPHPIEAIIE